MESRKYPTKKTIFATDAFQAGFCATFATSAMMQMNNALGALPDVHIARTLSNIMGMPNQVLAGWLAHFLIGTFVFSTVFALIESRIPARSYVVKGLLFGLLTWLGMMAVFMPIGGAGFFAMYRGPVVQCATLILNLVYGAVLGSVYGWSQPESVVRRYTMD